MLDASKLIGRSIERKNIEACLAAGRNVLLEGPVGVGKTFLALSVAESLNRPIYRIDGDGRYTEQKLTGWFDPPSVLEKGYSEETFIPGPLVQAMKTGGVLFINELNRMPEGVQNVLLPAIDERNVAIPYLSSVKAAAGFRVIATQNPKEFVATTHLSEAILDRFELVLLDYQNELDEIQIVVQNTDSDAKLASYSVALARFTREDERVRRGASVRAAVALASITQKLLQAGDSFEAAFETAAVLALPTRIEIERDSTSARTEAQEIERLIREWAKSVLAGKKAVVDSKKKP